MMYPIVSVICPIRNEEKHISACLQSLVRQTYGADKMEILVIDGMSEDGTRDIVRQFQLRHKHIRLVINSQKIVSTALNLGIQSASGKYILRMDGHAMPAYDYVEQCVAALECEGVDCVGGPIISINNTDTGKAIALAMSSSFGVGNARFRTSHNQKCQVDTLAFPAFKKNIFDKYGMFDDEMIRCQDDEFHFRIRKFGCKILLTPKIRSWYYPRSRFKALWKQYFGYGFWKVRILQKHLWMMQLRHFVPVTFISCQLLSLCLSLFFPMVLWIFISTTLLYSLFSLIAATRIWVSNREISILKIMLSFYTLHFSYGLGFLWALIRFASKWFQREGLLRV